MKICSKCNLEKPLELFTPNRNGGYRTYCKECNAKRARDWNAKNVSKYNNLQSQRRKDRIASGFCKYCLNEAISSKGVCRFHYVVNTANNSLGKCNKEIVEELIKRFDENPVCPYTGELLELGVNAHLDHIKSQKNHPELKGDINNVEWISEVANLSKNGFNKDEFIKFCKLIASRFG